MARVKFPRIKGPPKVQKPNTRTPPCIKCGKGLGTCRGGWCARCVQNHIDATTPNVQDIRQANEMLGRRAFSGTHARRLELPNQGE